MIVASGVIELAAPLVAETCIVKGQPQSGGTNILAEDGLLRRGRSTFGEALSSLWRLSQGAGRQQQ